MTSYRTVKLLIGNKGEVFRAPGSVPEGYGTGVRGPVIAVVEVPDDVSDDTVMRTYSRCMILPVMHADRQIPWHKISGAQQGQIIRLGPGRPHLDPAEKYIRINISISPKALSILDERGNGRSQEIERLIFSSVQQEPNSD